MINFNGKLTMKNKITEEWRTFCIRTRHGGCNFAPNKRTLSVLNGPDNVSNYQMFAFVEDDGFRVFNKYKYIDTNKLSIYQWYAKMLWEALTNPNSKFANDYEIMISKTCRICNRVLTTPESISLGIGPECKKRKL